MEEQKIDLNKLVIVSFLFVLSYFLLYALSLGREAIAAAVGETPVLSWFLPLPAFESPMFYLMPAVGFFMIYFIVDWINDYFKTKQALAFWFPLLYLFLALLAFYIAAFWYYANMFQLAGAELRFNYWDELKRHAYYLFVLAGLLGWVSRVAVKSLLEKGVE